ncbi:MAG: ABC transporter permease [Treponema sp.]|jgi:D-methionine transport system permease protein|nr:ABC transporter permease [Treponema sp.]
MNRAQLLGVLALLPQATLETIHMTFLSTVIAVILGFPLGVILYCSSPVGLFPQGLSYKVLSRIIKVLCSLPFIVLMILLIPLSRLIVGTSIGPTAVIVPLSIAAVPFVARIVESALQELDSGVLLAAKAVGSTNFQIIRKVLIPESLPSLVSGLTLTIVNLIGYSAMAGAIGGGGLGALAINYGYYRFRTDVTIAAVIVILILVELVQLAGTTISRVLLSKR